VSVCVWATALVLLPRWYLGPKLPKLPWATTTAAKQVAFKGDFLPSTAVAVLHVASALISLSLSLLDALELKESSAGRKQQS